MNCVTFKDITFCAKFSKLLLKILFYGTLDRSGPMPEYPNCWATQSKKWATLAYTPWYGLVRFGMVWVAWFVKLRYGRQIWTNPRVSKLLSHPVQVVSHIGVHPQGIWPGTPNTPGSYANGAVAPRVGVSCHKGAPTVPVTRVLAPRPCTDHASRDGPVPHHGPARLIVHGYHLGVA